MSELSKFSPQTRVAIYNRVSTEKKVQMANETCQSLIYAGIDVQLTTGQEHFSLEPNDQTNIDSMFTAVTLGATQYPYHSDGAQCKMYSAVDIVTLYVAYKTFVTKQTTYCNFLKIWVNRETDKDVLAGITYGSELPSDLNAEMEEILTAAAAEIQAIIGKMQQTMEA